MKVDLWIYIIKSVKWCNKLFIFVTWYCATVYWNSEQMILFAQNQSCWSVNKLRAWQCCQALLSKLIKKKKILGGCSAVQFELPVWFCLCQIVKAANELKQLHVTSQHRLHQPSLNSVIFTLLGDMPNKLLTLTNTQLTAEFRPTFHMLIRDTPPAWYRFKPTNLVRSVYILGYFLINLSVCQNF